MLMGLLLLATLPFFAVAGVVAAVVSVVAAVVGIIVAVVVAADVAAVVIDANVVVAAAGP